MLETASWVPREMALGDPPMQGGGRLSVCCSTPGTRGESEIPRTKVPKYSNASEWLGHYVDIEVGEQEWNAVGTKVDMKTRRLYVASSKTVLGGLIFVFGVQGPKSCKNRGFDSFHINRGPWEPLCLQ